MTWTFFRDTDGDDDKTDEQLRSDWIQYQQQALRHQVHHQVKREKAQSKRPKWAVGRQRR